MHGAVAGGGDLLIDRAHDDQIPCTPAPVSRRRFLVGSAALATGLGIAPAAAGIGKTWPASQFYNCMGVNVHSWYPDNGWDERLAELAVPSIRTRLGSNKEFLRRLGAYFAGGGKLDAMVVHSSGRVLDKSEALRNVLFLRDMVGADRLCGIEGPNEFNNSRQRDWAESLRDFVVWLHATVRAERRLDQVPLVAPSIGGRSAADYAALGDMSRFVDKGCIHFYSGGRRPSLASRNSMERALLEATLVAPRRPMWMTESGWQAPSGGRAVSLRAQAKYVLRNFFDAFGYGVEKLFVYQLMDDKPALYGLCDAGGRPKPAFHGVRNLAALMRDGGNGRAALPFVIRGAPPSLKSLAFSKSDGSFLVAFYLDVDSYDRTRGADLEAEAPVTLELQGSARSINVHRPTFSADVQQRSGGQKVALSAADHVTIASIRF